MKKVIIISTQFNLRQIQRFNLESLQKSFDLEYWDCSAIIKPKFIKNDIISDDYVRIIKSLSDFKHNIDRIPSDSILIAGFVYNANIQLLKSLSQKFSTIVNIDFWATSAWKTLKKMSKEEVESTKIIEHTINKKNAFSRLKETIYKNDFIRRIIKTTAVFLRNLKNNPFEAANDTWLQLIRIANDNYANKLINTIWISTDKNSEYPINLFDFEKYLIINKQNEPLIDGRYAVFLDVDFPNLPDLQILERDKDWSGISQRYYNSMNVFFSLVEKQYGVKVVVAAHPNAQFTKETWGGRVVLFGKTAELVKDCEFAMVHCSNSLAFAFFYDKPLIILDNGALQESSYIAPQVKQYSDAFEMDICNTDVCADVTPYVHSIKRDVRERFLSAFVNMDKPELNEKLLPKYICEIYDKIYGNM